MMREKLTVKSESIQQLYNFYTRREIIANRRYQRKLVWTIEEKESFVDSIAQGFPVPLILMAEVTLNGLNSYEIIDGMQRLDAVFTFIEGKFCLGGEFFDLETLATTKKMLDDGDLLQRKPVLNRDLCTEIVNYPLPLSIYEGAEQKRIEDIFQRINSGGKHLSRQELRQVGASGEFPNLVRDISIKVRGDNSHSDRLPLNQMSTISLSNSNLGYGINVEELFWIKSGIITHKNIRESRDEELIAHLLAYIILCDTDYTPFPTAENLDKLYGSEESPSDKDWGKLKEVVEDELNKKGREKIEEQFFGVFDFLKELLEQFEHSDQYQKDCKKLSERKKGVFTSLMFANRRIKKSQPHFQCLFLSLFKLIVQDNQDLKPDKYEKLLSDLYGMSYTGMTIQQQDNFSYSIREENTEMLRVKIAKNFHNNRAGRDPARDCWTTELETILSQSFTEDNLYDFKIGFLDLSTRNFNSKLIVKITKTLVGMANSQPKTTGYVVVGVADDKSDAEKHKSVYGTDYFIYKDFCIVGIAQEAIHHSKNHDQYYKYIKEQFFSQPIPDDLRNQICRDMRYVNYRDKTVLVLKVKSGKLPFLYEKSQYFERHGGDLKELDMSAYTEAILRFNKE